MRESRNHLLRAISTPAREGCLTHLEEVPAREAHIVGWPTWVPENLVNAWATQGIEQPYKHQVEAAELAYEGTDVVLATGTASGKSLGYLMPTLAAIEDSRGAKGERGAGVIYLAPTKALAHDQAAAIESLALPGLRCATHDGDSSPEARTWTRQHAEFMLTNPDMLHHSLLPTHQRWSQLLGKLRYLVVDECHHYRGVFGAHVSHIIRRLLRICASYGAHPTVVLASATIAEPAQCGSQLTGRPITAITDDGSPRGTFTVGLWQPPFTAGVGENGAPVRRSATMEAGDLLADLTIEGAQSLAFARSRQGSEAAAMRAQSLLGEVDPSLPAKVSAYRSGYLPEERRSLEGKFKSGTLSAMAATTALELGIDIHGLDAVLIAGFPGTRASFWQQLGRAGRRGQDALGLLIARDDPLDNYLVTHPAALLGEPVEASVFDPSNPHIQAPHLCAAAAEIPLTEVDLPFFGDGAAETLEALVEAGLLRKRPTGWFWTDRRRASDLADLRSTGGQPVQLIEADSGALLGTVDEASAPSMVYPGATYLHQGLTYLVEDLDLEQSVCVLRRDNPDYFTSPRSVSDIRILHTIEQQSWGEARLCFGTVEVTAQVVSFLKRRHGSGEVLAEKKLQMPEQVLQTSAVWWTLSEDQLAQSSVLPEDLPGAAHAAEHASIGLLPLFATCHRWDIGGVSTALHPDTGELTVFVHDGYPGGAGFAERGFAVAADWLSATRETIASCPCEGGCPSCVQSPKCGNQNNPLDKAGATALLDTLLAGQPAAR